MEPATLNERITFLNRDLSEVKTVYANVKAITAREQIRNGAEQITDSYTVKIRYLKDISPSLLLRWRDYIYEIVLLNADRKHNEIYLTIQYSNKNQDNFKTT